MTDNTDMTVCASSLDYKRFEWWEIEFNPLETPAVICRSYIWRRTRWQIRVLIPCCEPERMVRFNGWPIWAWKEPELVSRNKLRNTCWILLICNSSMDISFLIVFLSAFSCLNLFVCLSCHSSRWAFLLVVVVGTFEPRGKVPELGVQCWTCWKEEGVMAREKRNATQTPNGWEEYGEAIERCKIGTWHLIMHFTKRSFRSD